MWNTYPGLHTGTGSCSSFLPACAVEEDVVVGASAGLGAAPVGATAAGADAVPGTGAGAGVVEKVAADAVATAGVEGAVVAGADLGTAGS